MGWKGLLSDFIQYAAILFACFWVVLWISRSGIGSRELINCALAAIAVTLGIFGGEELDRRGQRTVHLVHYLLIFAFFISYSVFIIIMFCKNNVIDSAIVIFPWVFLAIFAAKFPLALCLKRNKLRSTSRPTIANAP